MKRFFSLSLFTLAFLIGAAGVAPATHAQVSCSTAGADPATCIPDAATGGGAVGGEGVVNVGAANAASAASAGQAISQAAGVASPKEAEASEAYGSVMQWILKLFAWLLGVAAITLNYAVYYTVVIMGAYVKDLSAIGVVWTVLRDIGNIFLIFGFLAVGVTTILNVDWYGKGTKMLPMMFVAAVFLNFSLFFTEAIIDTGNLFATQFYKQIVGGAAVEPPSLSLTTVGQAVYQEPISNKIMNKLGLQTLYGDGTVNPAIFKGANSWIIGFMGILLFIVTAFVFFALAFVLIARFIILIFLIILAPVGFAGLAVPGLAARAKQWWDKLFEQTITAPILLLMLYVALAVITDVKFLTGFGIQTITGGAATGFVDNTNLIGFGGFILSFIVAMGLLLAVVIQSKNLSAFGASWASKAAGGITGALSFGAISLAGRGTLGAAGYLLNNKRMQARAAGGGLGGFAAKVASFTGRNLENRTYDLRNVPGVRALGAATSAIPGVGGAGLGGVLAGGSAFTTKGAIDKTREGLKYIKPFSGDWWRNQQKEYEAAKSELDRKDTLAAAAVPPGPTAVAAQKELKKMSVDELAQLKDIRNGIDRLVFNLSPEKFNELMKSDKLLPGEKAKLQGTWDTQFTAANAPTTMSRFSTEEIASLGGGTLSLAPVIDTLGSTELDAIRRKGNLTKQQRHDIFAHLAASPAGSPLAAVFADYFLAANDPGGNRDKYWNV